MANMYKKIFVIFYLNWKIVVLDFSSYTSLIFVFYFAYLEIHCLKNSKDPKSFFFLFNTTFF